MNAVVQSNVDAENITAYSVDLNAATYKVLSDTLYSDKIGSVIREVCRNGADAHDMAGIPDEPIDVTIPTTLNPYFVVKDHGLGLSDSEMDDVYRHYFRSTKENSFGLGAKSPHAYTDSFTITSIKDGHKLFYTSTMGEDGIPHLVKLAEEATSEHNGVEVSIPVKTHDIYTFEDKVFDQCKFFDTFPIVHNSHRVFVDWKGTIVKRVGEIALTSNSRGYFTFIVKKVGYQIQPSTLAEYLTAKEFEFVKILGGSIWFVPEIETTPSREAISFSPKTVAIIKKILHTNHSKIKDEYTAVFNSFTTMFERTMWCAQNRKLMDGLDLKIVNDPNNDVNFHVFDSNSFTIELGGAALENVVSNVMYYRNYRRTGTSSSTGSRDCVVVSVNDTLHRYILVTENRIVKARINNYIANNCDAKVSIITVKDKAKFFADIGVSENTKGFVDESQFVMPPKDVNQTPREKIPVHRWLTKECVFSGRDADRVFQPLADLEGYYVVVETMSERNWIGNGYWAAYECFGEDKPIYVLKEKDLKKIDKTKLFSLNEEMKKLGDAALTPTNKIKCALYFSRNDYRGSGGWGSIDVSDIDDPDIKMAKRMYGLKETKEIKFVNSAWGTHEFPDEKGREDKLKSKVVSRMSAMYERLREHYPLIFNYYNGYFSDAASAEINWYIREKAKYLASKKVI